MTIETNRATDPDALFRDAHAAQRAGREREAADGYLAALALAPDHADSLANLGVLFAAAGHLDDAERLYRLALDAAADADVRCNLASLLHRQGRNDEAEAEYRQAIADDPCLATGLTHLGLLLAEQGRHREAEPLIREALQIEPRLAAAWHGLGMLLVAAGESAEALQALARAEDLAPLEPAAALAHAEQHLRAHDRPAALDVLQAAHARMPEAVALRLHLGSLLGDTDRHEAALPHLEAAAQALPDRPEAANNLALSLIALGHHGAAEPWLRQALDTDPRFAEAWINFSNCRAACGDPAGALEALDKAVAVAPGLAIAHSNRANALRQLGRLPEAEAGFSHALQLEPELTNAMVGLGLVLQQENRHEAAVRTFQAALERRPDYPEALNNLAVSLVDLGRLSDAAAAYQRLIALKPVPEALFNLGSLLQQLGLYDESITVLAEALRQKPDWARVYPFLAHSMMQQCRWDNLAGVVAAIRAHLDREVAEGRTVSVSAFALQSLPGEVPMALRRKVAESLSLVYVSDVRPPSAATPFAFVRRTGDRPLRIGYLSPDFRTHSVAVAFRGVLEAHDRDGFELYGYCVNPGPADALTDALKARFHGFRRLAELPYREAAASIHDDGIDILVDLAGHTRNNGLRLFALRPAPLQAHWLGYSATVGMPTIDYLITDHWQVPPEQRPHFAEQLVYLPDTFMATTRSPIDAAPPRRAAQNLPAEAFVFACFNGCYKLDPVLFGTWMRLLRRLPGAVLWLLKGSPGAVANLRAEAARRGIDPERLVFAEKLPHAQHLARLGLADLALDTLWHGGGVTTADALWAGLPVLSATGDTPQSRNGASLLGAIGLDELIVPDLATYEATAFRLASEPARLAALKARLRANRETEPLFRPERLTRHLEEGYRLIWRNHLEGAPPRTVEVPRLPD